MKIARWFVSLALVLALGLGLLAAPPEPPPKPSPKLLVPAYFYPAGKGLESWNKLIAGTDKATVIAIVNPASGPGTQVDPAYTLVIQQAQAAQVKLIAYVSTSYAQRSTADIKRDIDLWLQYYPTIQGFFFDEQSSDGAKADFYLDLATYARGKVRNAFIVTNPGIPCDEAYFAKNVADTICVIESANGLDQFVPPAWFAKYPAEKFYGLAYRIGKPNGMRTSIAAARKKRLGYLYITDDKLPNPWDTLPGYWQEELKAVK